MERLNQQIAYYYIDLSEKEPRICQIANEAIRNDDLVSPFTESNIKLAALLSSGAITLDEYIKLEREYGARNKYLYTYELSGPRTFGESWAQEHLNAIVPELSKPSKRLDPNYSGEYDFWYEGIKIEVKASRAAEDKSGGKLVDKALYSFDTTTKFNMNFQQLKPACCDVFVWMGVWRDAVRFWVLSSAEVESSEFYSSGQHRGNSGEGQLWIKRSNIEKFSRYIVEPNRLLTEIVRKGEMN